MTLPGIPGIYYGDELATTSDWARSGSDTALRPAMTTADAEHGGGGAHDLLTSVRRLGELRRANPRLRTAVLTDVRTQRGVLTHTTTGDSRSWRVYLNPTAAPVAFPADNANHIDVPAHGWAIHTATNHRAARNQAMLTQGSMGAECGHDDCEDE